MSNYLYEAVDAGGARSTGTLDVINQSEALRRIRDMGLFPLLVRQDKPAPILMASRRAVRRRTILQTRLGRGSVKPAALTAFTRQLATLVDVGMPLLRGLKLLEQQESNGELKRVIGELSQSVETGGSMSEALSAHPKVFGRLYINMVRAGEAGGILEQVLKRQAEFMEKGQRIKAKIKAAMFYPVAVMIVAAAIMTLLLVFVIPRFQEVFAGLLGPHQMPAFTMAVLNFSSMVKDHILALGLAVIGVAAVFQLIIHTRIGRRYCDGLKLIAPVFGRVTSKASLARFARTLGTLLSSGVPILQALKIVKETAGNVMVGEMIGHIHDNVKEGGTLAEPFKASRIFPPVIGGMVDVGEQTGALPDMLIKIADTSDEEVDNAVTAMTSLLEPVMLIFLAVVVGSIVIAMFLPIFALIGGTANDGIGGNM